MALCACPFSNGFDRTGHGSRTDQDQFKTCDPHCNKSCTSIVESKIDSNIGNKGKALKVSASVTNNTWIIDSGATEHMTCESRQVQILKPPTKTVVSVANSNVVPIIGEGTVSLSDTLSLDTVLVDIWTRKTIGYGIRKGKLYYLELTSNSSRMLTHALAVDGNLGDRNKASEVWLWHHRLGHASFGYLRRSDNGGEYVNSELRAFLDHHGIVHQTTCPYTPQQNGVAKRKNRQLLEVVRASLLEARLPLSYWGEALTSAVYLINRVPSRSVDFQTPLQALSSHVDAPAVPNLPPHVFGCVAFVHLHKQQRSKLEPRALRCVFVGYASR
ncbi:hypothetical protein ACFX1S_035911 [Malus domestica]